jgi:hypothetical protein
MWFAALYPGYDPQRDANPNSPMHWFGQFLTALLQHKQPVWDLLEPPPFPVEKITHIRARLYRYHFTPPETQKVSGEWWERRTPRQLQRHRDAECDAPLIFACRTKRESPRTANEHESTASLNSHHSRSFPNIRVKKSILLAEVKKPLNRGRVRGGLPPFVIHTFVIRHFLLLLPLQTAPLSRPLVLHRTAGIISGRSSAW